jgi:membrane protein YdbS with pleckstrin-like domain
MAYTFHPFPVVRAMKTIIVTMILIIMLFFFRQTLSELYLPIIAFVVAFGLLSVLSAFALARTFNVTLGETAIVYRYGVTVRNEYILPYSKITEARFSQSLLEQFFGLGTLTIDTAGFMDLPLHISEVRLSDIRKAIDAIDASNAPGAKR